MLVGLYSGAVTIWNYQSQSIVKTIEVCDLPVRTAKFIARKNWIVAGADDLLIRIFNYNTGEKIAAVEGHTDYIRSLAVHASKPYVLSGSDDATIRLWDWDRGWKCVQTFEGHSHYVMSVAWSPKDANTFASASLDRTIKVWSVGGAGGASYTLEGHEKGVNAVAFYGGADRPYLVSGADDATVRVWDYQSRACVRVLEGHGANVACVLFHSDLPVLLTGAEDAALKVWNANTFRLEATYNFGLERIWALAIKAGTGELAIGCDEGAAAFALGKGEPAASIDATGKVIWTRHNSVLTVNVRNELDGAKDGAVLALQSKELGSCEMYPQSLQHSPNGRFVVVTGDGEYIVYTAVAWRNKTFGKAADFCWASDSNDYAVRSGSGITVYQNFVETASIRISGCDQLFGGVLIGASVAGQLCFFDWKTCALVRRIDASANKVYWSEGSQRVAVCTDASVYILQYDSAAAGQQQHEGETEDGLESAFTLVDELGEKVASGTWVGDCFVFVAAGVRVGYFVGGQSYQLALCDRPLHLLGFLAKEGRVVLADKEMNLVTYELSLALLEYQSAVLRDELDKARELLHAVPDEHRGRAAHFLESQGLREEALQVSLDADHRFELALALKKLDVAYEIVQSQPSQLKWRLLGDRALADWKIALAEKCFVNAEDWASLLLLYAAAGNASGLASVAGKAGEAGLLNVAFASSFIGGKRDECFQLLLDAKRYAEAAIFARTYAPSLVDKAVAWWARKEVAGPGAHPALFPEFVQTRAAEDALRSSSSVPGRPRFVSFDARSGVSDENAGQCVLLSPHVDTFSDHMSMEVNTTGTGSVRAEDIEEMIRMGSGGGDDAVSATAAERLDELEELEIFVAGETKDRDGDEDAEGEGHEEDAEDAEGEKDEGHEEDGEGEKHEEKSVERGKDHVNFDDVWND